MAKTANPFTEYDFTKIWSEFKLPQFDVEAFVAAQQRNMEAVSAANKMAIEGLQTAAQRQFELVRETMEKGAEATQEFAKLTKPEERLAQQAKYAKAAFVTGMDNAREIAGIVTSAANEAADTMGKRIVEGLGEWEDIMTQTAGSAAKAKPEAPKAATK